MPRVTKAIGRSATQNSLIKILLRILRAEGNAIHWRYQKDLSEYTFGQGGYDSLQQYSSVSLPVSDARRTGWEVGLVMVRVYSARVIAQRRLNDSWMSDWARQRRNPTFQTLKRASQTW